MVFHELRSTAGARLFKRPGSGSPIVRYLAALIVPLCIVADTSCTSSISGYPTGWPRLGTNAAEGCQHLAGTYVDSGEMAFGNYAIPGGPLSALLVQDRPQLRATSVKVSVASGQLKVTVLSQAGELALSIYTSRNNEYACRAGVAVLQKRDGWQGTGAPDGTPLLAHVTSVFELHGTADALVIKRERRQFMLIFIIPTKDRSTEWYRFQRLTAATTNGIREMERT